MVALLPVAGALRDTFLAAGLGFLLGGCYRILRFVLGDSKASCFVCDVLLCVLAALFYRSAAVGSFAAGVMRWYTMLAFLGGYALCQAIFARPLLCMAGALRFVLLWPFCMIYRHTVRPVWQAIHTAICKTREKQAKKRVAMREKCKRDLPKGQKMLYNSQ